MTRLSVLSVGSAPSAVFLAWRLAASRSCSVSVAWSDLSPKSPGLVPIHIASEQFGPNGSFTPDAVFDYNDLGSISTSSVSPNSSSDEVSQPRAFDIVLLSLASLRQLSKIQKALHAIIIPGQTLIIVDASRAPPVQMFVRQKFPRNPVCGLVCDASVCRSGLGSFDPSATVPSLKYLHAHAGKTIIEPLAGGPAAADSKLRDLVLYLQTSGVDANTANSRQAFLQLQWTRAIPIVALEPLSIVLEMPDPHKLVQSVMAKPIYEGLISELIAIAKQQGCDVGSPQSLIDSYLASPARSIPAGAQFPWPTAPLLYYNFYNWFPIPADVLLLHPILLSDELQVHASAPYLECVFAMLTQLSNVNDPSSRSLLFQRRDIFPSSASSSSDRDSNNSGKSLTPPSVTAASLRAREDIVARREHELVNREQALFAREQHAKQMFAHQQLAQQQFAQSQFSQHPPPQQYPHPQQQQQHPHPHYQPPRSAPQGSPKRGGDGAPSSPNMSHEIDMMSITARRGRRSLGNGLDLPGGSPGGPAPSPGHGSLDQFRHRMSSPSLSSMAQPFSQKLDLGDVLSSSDDRYGGVVSQSTLKRLSSSYKTTRSRSNSISSQAQLGMLTGPPSPFGIPNLPSGPSPPVSQTNLGHMPSSDNSSRSSDLNGYLH